MEYVEPSLLAVNSSEKNVFSEQGGAAGLPVPPPQCLMVFTAAFLGGPRHTWGLVRTTQRAA